MAKKNRTSVLKRQREAEKRQRLARKAAKTALKRKGKTESPDEQSPTILNEDVE